MKKREDYERELAELEHLIKYFELMYHTTDNETEKNRYGLAVKYFHFTRITIEAVLGD